MNIGIFIFFFFAYEFSIQLVDGKETSEIRVAPIVGAVSRIENRSNFTANNAAWTARISFR